MSYFFVYSFLLQEQEGSFLLTSKLKNPQKTKNGEKN